MQIDMQANEQIANILRSAENVAIIPAKNAGNDAFCAGVGLYAMLKSLDKLSKILYPGNFLDSCKELVRDSDVIASFSQRQLTVSIDYAGEHDAKAWYEPEGETLKVKLAPVGKDFDPTIRVKAKLESGFEFDTAIVIGAIDYQDLGYVYEELRGDLTNSTVINISNSIKNNRFGSINVIDPSSDSLSQLIIKRAPLWELNITTQAAQALLLGITQK